MTKVAIVTGSNKGIGLAIVRGLCKKFDGDVYILARNVDRGQEAVKLLEKEGLHPKIHQFDVCDVTSIERLRDFMTSQYGGIDVLVNNAGIAYNSTDPVPMAKKAEDCVRTNYIGTVDASRILFPVVRDGGRIVNVSSTLSIMYLKKLSDENQKFFRSKSLTEEELTAKMEEFVESTRKGTVVEDGFVEQPYGMSKVGMSALTFVWARKLKSMGKNDVIINAVCPGWVRTDLGGEKASRTPDQGAEAPIYLATLPAGVKSPNGEFVSSEKNIREW